MNTMPVAPEALLMSLSLDQVARIIIEHENATMYEVDVEVGSSEAETVRPRE